MMGAVTDGAGDGDEMAARNGDATLAREGAGVGAARPAWSLSGITLSVSGGGQEKAIADE